MHMFHYNRKYPQLVSFLILIALILIPFYKIIFLGRTLTTGIVTDGVMGKIPSQNYEQPQYSEVANVPDRGSTAWEDEPIVVKLSRLYHAFQFPLWNSTAGFGKPLGPDMTSAAFTLLHILLFISPQTWIFDVTLLLRLVVSACFMYLFLQELKLEKAAAMAGAVLFALSGYFIYYVNMGHLNVEIFLPLLLLSVHRLCRQVSFLNMTLLGGVVFLMVTGGHPESMVICFCFGVVYFLYNYLLQVTHTRRFTWQPVVAAVGAAAVACGVASFLIVPFLEFFLYADLGVHTEVYRIFAEVIPLKFLALPFFPVLIKDAVSSANNNYWSSVALFVMMLGFFHRKFRSTIFFFTSVALVLIWKIYGLADVEWLGHIPLLNNFVYCKYLQPDLSLCLGVLTAVGVSYLHTARLKVKEFGLGIAAVVATFLMLSTQLSTIPHFEGQKHWWFAILFPVMTAGALFVVSRVYRNIPRIQKYPLAALMAASLVIIEMMAVMPKDKPRRGTPYLEPTYVKYLLQQHEPFRAYSPDGILYPETSIVFDIDDIQDVYSVYVKQYIPYIKNFIDPSIFDRFSDPSLAVQYRQNPLFDLTNAKYMLTINPLPSDTMVEVMQQNHLPEATSSAFFIVNGEAKSVLYEAPPNVYTLKLTPTAENAELSFYPMISPVVWQPQYGDGVEFQVSAVVNGYEQQLFSRLIDPKNKKSDQVWQQVKLDLKPFIGRAIELRFKTLPQKSTAYDWAAWGELSFINPQTGALMSSAGPEQFLQRFHDQVYVWENTHAFPRLFAVPQVLPSPTEAQTVTLMKASTFNLHSTAVVQVSASVSGQLAQLVARQPSVASGSSSISITRKTDTGITAQVKLPSTQLVVLTDIFYPGWKAYVDGKPVPIYQTDLAFRGIVVPAGQHKLEFQYQPMSYVIGGTISLVTVIVLIGYIWVARPMRFIPDRSVEEKPTMVKKKRDKRVKGAKRST